MRIAPALIVLSLGIGGAAQAENRPAAQKCQGLPNADIARGQSTPAQPRRLDRLPSGNLELAVWREVERCQIPAVVRTNITPTRR